MFMKKYIDIRTQNICVLEMKNGNYIKFRSGVPGYI